MRHGLRKDFFGLTKNDKKLELNTKIWNNEEVFNITNYSIDHLKKCMFDLALFISNNLSPNRLECFDI